MVHIIAGIFSFLLFIIYDYNSVGVQNRLLHKTFLIGCLILIATTGAQIWAGMESDGLRRINIPLLIPTAASALLLIYTLFFALPFKKTYCVMGEQEVYDKGMYALCRHPGVVWFGLFYVFLGLSFIDTKLLRNGILYSLCNLVYVMFQDNYSFPMTFKDYDKYKMSTPFLIPTFKSIKRAFMRI